MAVLSTTRSIPQLVEALFGVGNATLPIQHVYKATVTVTTPTVASAIPGVVTATVTGARVGDVVVAVCPTAAQVANQFPVAGYVTANDTVTLVFDHAAAVTGASKSYNLVVLSFS